MYTIKQLRRKKNISQTELGKQIGVSLRTIQLYERKDANIPIKNLTKIAEFFGLTIAELYMREVNDMGEAYTKRQPFTKHNSVFYPLDQGKHLVMAPLVLVEHQEKYIQNVMAEKVSNPFQAGFVIDFLADNPHRIFEVSGDSMNDGTSESIPNGAFVLGLELKKESFVRSNETSWNLPYVIITANRIICKWLTGYNKKNKTLTCHNLNTSPEYQDFDLTLDEVFQVFKVVKKQI